MKKIFISCKESIIENNRSFYGSFSIGPFSESQSLTIGNALRRTLLTECPGLAIISVVIENVTHEYSTLPGVRDSVLDILLNLKEIVLKKETNPWLLYKRPGVGSVYNTVGSSFFKPIIGYLKIKGPGIVRAKDLRLPPFIKIVDPDQYIATLSENGFLNMKFVIMEGKSYLIQKNTDFINYSMVKKRRLLLKNLKDLVSKSNISSKNQLVLKEALNAQSLTTRLLSSKDKKKDETHIDQPLNDFKNASPLNIDAVFNPIKKVNYIIEVNDNNIVNYSNEKNSFIDEISSFMESGDLYKRSFPFLTNTFSGILPEKLNFNNLNVMKNLIDYVESYSTEELWTDSRSLHPLRKDGLLHNVILEIWTNGSIHPREALSLSFANLTNLFLNFEKTKIYSPMYKEISSYKKCLTNLPTNLKQSKDNKYTLIGKDNSGENSLGNMSLDISVLNLNLRSYTCLKRANINNLKDLSLLSKEELVNNYYIDLPTVELILKTFRDVKKN